MWVFTSDKSDDKKSRSASSSPAVVMLVIQADGYDWPSIFSGTKLNNGREVNVTQVGWEDIISIHADTYTREPTRPIIEVRRSATETGSRNKIVRPEFVLIRNEVMTPSFDGRQLLSGLMFAGVPSINSLQSIYQCNDRAAMMGYLHSVNRKLGNGSFPIVKQHFTSGSGGLMYGYTFPAVVKVGSAHAGAGKMKITDHHQMSDFRSVLAMMPKEHCFVEPFVKGAYDLRIQKIGPHLRAFRRRDVSGEWKTNTGTALMEEVSVEPRWAAWVEEAKAMFGGLDILTVDAIVEESTQKECIIEVNGTSSGLHPDCADEDNNHIRDLVMERLNEIF